MQNDKPKTLLVIDDDPTVRFVAVSGLKRQGYQVLEADNGKTALACFEQYKPDLILLDVLMPIMNGFETLRAIRQRTDGSNVPVLMLTGSDDVKSINESFEAGATDFITKPINLPLLVQRIRYALRGASREATLREVYLQQDTACKLARLGFWHLNLDTKALQWSLDAAELIGWQEALPGHVDAFLEHVAPDDKKRMQAAFELALTQHEGINIEVTLGHDAQQGRVLRLQSTNRPHECYLIGAFQDVTALRAFEDHALYLTGHDELTDLPNQRLFMRMLYEHIKRRETSHCRFAVILFDIDRLHRINDGFGIQAGDNVLKTFAQRLQQYAPPESIISRLEADTFVLVCSFVEEVCNGEYPQFPWLDHLERPYLLAGKEIFIDFSAGISLYPFDETDAEVLLELAKRAQRHARKKTGLKFDFYHNVQTQIHAPGIMLETDLRFAQEKNEFFLVYQPQQNLATSEIVGVEALLRWRHEKRGIVSPVEFIPLLEETGQIQKVGDWIIGKACEQSAIWRKQGIQVRMGINLSALQFEQSNLPELIKAHIEYHNLPAESIEFEITESLAMSNPEATLFMLQKLKQLGLKIAIDDFGTGYSSFEYLQRFPLDKLKVDRSFVMNVTEDARSRSIIRALNVLGNGLNLKIIAEGVETQRQRDYLDALGIHEIQGYLLAKPLTHDAFEQFYSHHNELLAQLHSELTTPT